MGSWSGKWLWNWYLFQLISFLCTQSSSFIFGFCKIWSWIFKVQTFGGLVSILLYLVCWQKCVFTLVSPAKTIYLWENELDSLLACLSVEFCFDCRICLVGEDLWARKNTDGFFFPDSWLCQYLWPLGKFFFVESLWNNRHGPME